MAQNWTETVKDIWDQERPVSPALVRTALTFLGLLLGALAVLNVLGGLGDLLTLRVGSALVKFTSGIAIPLAIWIGLRLLADLVILQNQAVERLSRLAGEPPQPSATEAASPADDASGDSDA